MKAIVSLSGGMDSSTVLGEALATGAEVQAVGFYYGSKHNKFENAAAWRIAAYYRVPFRLLDLSAIMGLFNSALTTGEMVVPEGHFEQESMRQTIVPNRNMIFLSILTGIAVSEGTGQIWLGVHAGDHFIYPDCRPAFVETMQKAIRVATDTDLCLVAPFLDVTKKEILQRGLVLNPAVPYHLTRTCYKQQETACGRCGSCQERLSAWKDIGQEDPIDYEARILMPKK